MFIYYKKNEYLINLDNVITIDKENHSMEVNNKIYELHAIVFYFNFMYDDQESMCNLQFYNRQLRDENYDLIINALKMKSDFLQLIDEEED